MLVADGLQVCRSPLAQGGLASLVAERASAKNTKRVSCLTLSQNITETKKAATPTFRCQQKRPLLCHMHSCPLQELPSFLKVGGCMAAFQNPGHLNGLLTCTGFPLQRFRET